MPLPSASEQFGRWTVVGEPYGPSKHRFVPCRCTCGTKRGVSVGNLRAGKSTNCGCKRAEYNKARSIHGYAARGNVHPLYRLWAEIVKRCTDPNAQNYPWYGGRGVAICQEWRHDPAAFIAWMDANLGWRPPNRTLDRINPEGNYEPGNLRWATYSEQRRNRRTPDSLPTR